MYNQHVGGVLLFVKRMVEKYPFVYNHHDGGIPYVCKTSMVEKYPLVYNQHVGGFLMFVKLV